MDFNSVLIGSDNPEQMFEYYTRLFGAPQMVDGGYAGWQIGSGWISIGAHSEVHGQSAEPGRILLNFESTDVRGDFDRLAAAGAIVVREPYRMDDWPPDTLVATLADPDGNYFQLVSPMGPESAQ
jgi:predicted enzyme related to lactoylglutathione lyase